MIRSCISVFDERMVVKYAAVLVYIFLLISLAVSAMGADGTEVYGKQQNKIDMQAGLEAGVQETGKTVESVKRAEPVILNSEEAEPIIVEPVKLESAQFLEMDIEENNIQRPVPSPISESSSLFPDNFQSVLFIGDSRTVGLHEYGQMGKADVFANSGMTVFNLWDSKISSALYAGDKHRMRK